MQQFGGKDSKRHFTVVMGGKEHGLYVSSTPSSAAKKAVTKLCAANKSKKVEFHIREITQGSKKKTYGPYEGYIEKLKEPIELKGRVIKYKPVAKLGAKKDVQKGGSPKKYIDMKCHKLGIKGNNLSVNDENFAKSIKNELLVNPIFKGMIQEIKTEKNFLRIHLNGEGQKNADYLRQIADGIYGCNARLIENKFEYNKSKESFTYNNKENPILGSYIGNFIPPNNKISKTFQ